MKLLHILLNVMFCWSVLYAGGGKNAGIHWASFDNGLADAKKSNKKVLVDVYTDWCGWCKRMDHDTYSNDSVSTYLTKQFVLVKLNAESEAQVHYKGKPYSEETIARGFGVTGYPTIIFLDSEGKHITSLPSYLGPDKFLTVAMYIGEDYYKKMTWEEYSASLSDKGKKSD